MNYLKYFCAALLWPHPTASGSANAQTQPICPIPSFGTWQIPTTCPVDLKNSVENEVVPAQKDQWFRSDTCHKVGSDSFCAFTQPAFNAGHGIALVTTAEILEKVVSLPIFTIPGLQKSVPERSPSLAYRDEQIPGKGIGLVAIRQLQNNEAFLTRLPIVMVDDTAFKRLGRARLTELLSQAIGDLPEPHQAEYLNLTTHEEVKTHHERVYEIFMKNDFVTPVDNVMEFHSVFPQSEYSRRLLSSISVPHG
ncbi:hypothetical protein diail_2658 [Diaporthe ilicicola]|nr:hypothetical protein diail_2658 [Diaporthe ilicicola]